MSDFPPPTTAEASFLNAQIRAFILSSVPLRSNSHGNLLREIAE
jgi:hypothetical protein